MDSPPRFRETGRERQWSPTWPRWSLASHFLVAPDNQVAARRSLPIYEATAAPAVMAGATGAEGLEDSEAALITRITGRLVSRELCCWQEL